MNRNENEKKFIQSEGYDDNTFEQLLLSAYSQEVVSNDMKVRLKNRLDCQRVMRTDSVSFWWLPATLATIISFALAGILCVVYVVVNINGACSWMPNLLQLVSEIWLKIHLAVIVLEVIVSWLVTILGVWKGNLVKSARIM
ncbi:MAG: hypothetical protein IJD40_01765 [Lachnospiraceae bacterium]|nr:hypothetical protein [Lachnospiraceae bacterium]